MSNVTNGQANITIDTTGMSEGKYKVVSNYLQNDYYNPSTTTSTLALNTWEETSDSATLSNWFTPPNCNQPTLQNVNNEYYVKAGVNTYDANCYKIPIYRNAKTTLEFTIILYSSYGIFGLKTLKTDNNRRLNDNIFQYVPQWNAFGIGSRKIQYVAPKNTPITMKLEINNGVLKVIANNTTIAENLSFNNWYNDPEFNDYFFLFIESIYSSDNVLLNNINIKTTHLVEGEELQQVMTKYEGQFN